MEREMKLMDLAVLIDNMAVGDMIDFIPCKADDADYQCGGWMGVKRIAEFDMDAPMYLVSIWGGDAETCLYHISEYDHRIGDFCAKEVGDYGVRSPQNWINCCAKMIADYLEGWGEGYVPEILTVEVV